MTILRALLACVWVLFSLTATATPPAMASAMPCHMETTGKPHKPEAPAPLQTVMPCCSQPVLAAAAEPVALSSRLYEVVRLSPAEAAPLRNLPARLEPRPPKTV